MSLIGFKNKTEPKYTEPKKITFPKDDFDTKSELNNKENLMIGDGVTITGNIKANNEVIIIGNVDGEIECNSIIIKKSGSVKGKIKTKMMTVTGKVEGEININGVLKIKSEGSVNGKIFYDDLQIDEGGKLSGEIDHRDKDKKQEKFNDWKTI